MGDARNNQWVYHAIVAYIVLYYIWIIVFKENTTYFTTVANVFQTIPIVVTTIWLLYVYIKTSNKNSCFWLMMSMGAGINLIAQLIRNYYEIGLKMVEPNPSWSDFFWMLSATTFLVAIVYKFYNKKSNANIILLIIDTMIIMCIGIAVTWIYIISPNMVKLEQISFLKIVAYVVYPIVDLGVLFVVTSLYLSPKEDENDRKHILMMAIAFFVMCIANLMYSYLGVREKYVTGNMLDPLWSAYLFLLALSGVEYIKSLPSSKPVVKNATKRKEDIQLPILLPGISVMLLFGFSTFEHNTVAWVCSAISIFLINIRQIIVNFQNKHLIKKLQYLNETLETKVDERTKELFEMAFYDHLTNLPNRRLFENHLENVIQVAKKNNTHMALMFLDLDRFKMVNDTLGHSFGDILLRKIAERLESCIDSNCSISRQGGDEFAIIMQGAETEEDITALATKILNRLTKPVNLNGHYAYVTCSIGIAVYPMHGEEPQSLLKHADTAMYHSKEKGKNTYSFYHSEMDIMALQKLSIERGSNINR